MLNRPARPAVRAAFPGPCVIPNRFAAAAARFFHNSILTQCNRLFPGPHALTHRQYPSREEENSQQGEKNQARFMQQPGKHCACSDEQPVQPAAAVPMAAAVYIVIADQGFTVSSQAVIMSGTRLK